MCTKRQTNYKHDKTPLKLVNKYHGYLKCWLFRVLLVVVVVFPQAPFRVTNVSGQASASIIQLRNCTLAPCRGALGDFVTPFVLERLFDYSCFC